MNTKKLIEKIKNNELSVYDFILKIKEKNPDLKVNKEFLDDFYKDRKGITGKIKNELAGFIKENEDYIKKSGEDFSQVEMFGRLLLLNFFQKNGFFKTKDEKHSLINIKEKLGLLPKYEKEFEMLILILVNEGLVNLKGDELVATGIIESAELKKSVENMSEFKENLISKFSDMKPHFNLLEVCVSNLGEILSGKKSADGVMFPVFSMDLVEGIFKNNRLSDYFNHLTAKSVTDYIKLLKDKIKDRIIKVLEIGSGSAGTSVFVLEEMAKYSDVEFYFTDISKIFVRGGEKKLKEKYPFAVFKRLDIENEVSAQGFDLSGFDVVFASNVIHSTKDLRQAMSNTRSLLTNNGVFILNEVTETQDFLNLTFGLIDGWWKFEDTDLRLKNSPLLSISLWEGFLKKSGFNNVSLISTSHQDKPNSFSQSIFISEKNVNSDIKEYLELLYMEIKNNTLGEKDFEKALN